MTWEDIRCCYDKKDQNGWIAKAVEIKEFIVEHRVATQPRKVMSPGIQMGLTVLLDVQQDEYLCPGAESIGFKVRRVKNKK